MAKMQKVLFVSAEAEEGVRFRNLFNAHFKSIEFFHVTEHQEAIDTIRELDGVSLIIIDAALRVDDLEFFFTEVSRLNNNYPVIFYGTEAFLKSRVPDNMYDFNLASGLLLRPLNVHDFLSSVNRSLGWVREREIRDATLDLSAENFIPFKVRSFFRMNSVQYPIYMQITEQKFIRVFEAEEHYTHEQLHRYVKKGVRYLYFEKRDYLLFLSESMAKLRTVLEDPNCSFKLLAQAQIQGCMIIQEYARAIGLNESIVDFLYLLLSTIQGQYKEIGDIKKVLTLFPFKQQDIYARAILNAYICLAVIKELNWQSELTFQKLGVAAIFYDALINNDELLQYASIEEIRLSESYDEEEIEDFKQHPVRAAELIRLSQGLPECDFIIQQHHERPDSSGYPQGISSNNISGIVAIFILSAELVHQLSFYGITKKSLKVIVDELNFHYNAGNFKEPLKVLTSLLKSKK